MTGLKEKAIIVCVCVTLLSTRALGWEATRPTALPSINWALTKEDEKQRVVKSAADQVLDQVAAGNFDRRVVAYPYSDGASLGQGWNFVADKKTMSSCISFKAESDLYQEATYDLQQTMDLETLDVSLNVSLGGEAHGTYAGFTASAQATSSFSSAFHYKSTDQVLVAHASVVNGATFVTPVDQPKVVQANPQMPPKPKQKAGPGPVDQPPREPSPGNPPPADQPPDGSEIRHGKAASPGSYSKTNLQLAPEMAKLAHEDPEKFRDTCGDGFVSSVVSGADLYVLYHLADVTRSEKLTLEYHTKAKAGFGGLFGGSGNTDISATVTEANTANRLNIHLRQAGGVITQFPIDESTVKLQLSRLPAEARAGPRPIFMVVMPYSSLPNWEAPMFRHSAGLRQAAARYQTRLVSVYFEYLNIRQNLKRDFDSPRDGDAKYFLQR